MNLLARFQQWRHSRAVKKYESRPDKVIEDLIEPFSTRLDQREERLRTNFAERAFLKERFDRERPS